MVGLGRMGANMGVRLMRAGHEVVGYDRAQANVDSFAQAGGLSATGVGTIHDDGTVTIDP